MNWKSTLISAGLLTIGYQAGKIVGYVRSAKLAFDTVDQIVPGAKKTIVKMVSDNIIESIFKTKEKEENNDETES